MTSRFAIADLAGAVALLWSAVAGADVLTPGTPVSRAVGVQDKHSFEVRAEKGHYASVTVEQKDADVAVSLFGPDQKLIARTDTASLWSTPEQISFVAETAGLHRIEVEGLARRTPPPSFEIRLTALRAATEQDRARVAGERVYAAAEDLRNSGAPDSLKKAIPKYEEAVALWQSSGDDLLRAKAIHGLAFMHGSLNDYAKGMQLDEEARALYQAGGDLRGEASALSAIGVFSRVTGNSTKALESYQAALALQRQSGDRFGESLTLNNLGYLAISKDDHEKAVESLLQALAIRRELEDRRAEADTLNALGVSSRMTGRPEKALEYYGQTLDLKRQTNDARGMAMPMQNIGAAYVALGDFEKAIGAYEQSLQLSRTHADKMDESTALLGMGMAYKLLGEYAKAVDLFEQGHALKLAIGDKRGQAQALTNLGLGYEVLGDLKQAVRYDTEALALHREVGNRRDEAFTLANLGSVYAALGERDKAREHFEQALTIQRAIHDPHGEAETLLSLAELDRDLGDLGKARQSIESALKLVEAWRSRVANQTLRASYLAFKQDHYKFYVDLLMRMHERDTAAGHDAEAFAAAEQGRARGFRDLLAESRAQLTRGIDPAVLERRAKAEQQLNVRERDRLRVLSAKSTDSQRATAELAVDKALAEYRETEAQMRANNPRYAALTDSTPISVADLQRLLDADTTVVEYALGRDRSYAWIVTQKSLRTVTLAGQPEIEKAARRYYDLLSAPPKREREPALRASAREVSQLVVQPLAKHIGRKRVVVVADGALQYVPFAALPLSGDQPLVMSREVVMLPSASVLPLLRADAGRRRAPRSVAVLADPVLRADDPRVRAQVASAAMAKSPDQVRAARELGLEDFERLPSTRVEADAIVSLTSAGSSLKATDFDANRRTALDPRIRDYRYVHLATHGLVNTRRPELSGVVLSLVDADGRSQDGFLRLHDIYNMDLQADLVVMSACQTALGKEMKGEGLIGLSRGFMYAGTPRVVASLWDVRDATTAELMKRFYEKMIKEGRSPASALQAAQMSFVREGRPVSTWAAFILQGEWN